MEDIESSGEDDDDPNLHKTFDIECEVIDENDEASETERQKVEENNLVVNALSVLRTLRKSELAHERKVH